MKKTNKSKPNFRDVTISDFEIEPNVTITESEIDENGIKIIKSMVLHTFNIVDNLALKNYIDTL